MLDLFVTVLKYLIEHNVSLPVDCFHVIDSCVWKPYQWAGLTIAGFNIPLFFRKEEGDSWHADFSYYHGCAVVADVIGQATITDVREIQSITAYVRAEIIVAQTEEIKTRWAKGKFMIGDIANRRVQLDTFPEGVYYILEVRIKDVHRNGFITDRSAIYYQEDKITHIDTPIELYFERGELSLFTGWWRPDCVDPYNLTY